MENTIKASDKEQIASYEVAQLITQTGKLHTTGQTLTDPACRITVKCILGKDTEVEINKIPLSNNTIYIQFLESLLAV